MGGEVSVLSQQGPWRSGLLGACFNPRSRPVLCSCRIFQLYFVKSSTKDRSHKLFLKKKMGLTYPQKNPENCCGQKRAVHAVTMLPFLHPERSILLLAVKAP